jgi:hypothetical protein
MNLDLTQFYCSSGQKHKINILVFKDESKTIELSIKEAADIVKSKDDKKISNFARYKLINENYKLNGYDVFNETVSVLFNNYIINIIILHDGAIKYCSSSGEKIYID